MSEVFTFGEQLSIEERRIISAALGASTGAPFGANDVGKAAKMGTLQNYVPVADGDELEGFVNSVEPFTVNAGFSFGTIQRGGDMLVEVIGATPVALRDYVVAGAPVALGTAGKAKVKPGSPTKFLWRVTRIVTGTGAAGDQVYIRREN